MIKKKIKWIVEKNKKKKNTLRIFLKKNVLLSKKSMFLKNFPLNINNNNKLIKNKNMCLKRGKYNNNFSVFKMSRHYIKYLVTWKLIYLASKKW